VPWLLSMSNAMRGCACPGPSPLRHCSANCSQMTALTRCARMMHRQALATTRPKALRLWRMFQNNQGGTHGGTVTYTTGGRGQMPTCFRLPSDRKNPVVRPLVRLVSDLPRNRSGVSTLTTCPIPLLRGKSASISLAPGTAPRLGTCLKSQTRVQCIALGLVQL
jgi:hypothetical protein